MFLKHKLQKKNRSYRDTYIFYFNRRIVSTRYARSDYHFTMDKTT